jgi:hypothetical protein
MNQALSRYPSIAVRPATPDTPEYLEECTIPCKGGILHLFICSDEKHYGYDLCDQHGDGHTVVLSLLPEQRFSREEAKRRVEDRASRYCDGEIVRFNWSKCTAA